MSDDEFVQRGDGSSWGNGKSVKLTRHSTVTDDLDTIFNVLQSARRRYVLYYLYSTEDTVTGIEEIADAVSTYEAAGTKMDEFPSRQEIRIDLHHAQVPHLDTAGIIDYDRRQGTIRFTGSPSLEEWVKHARYMEFECHSRSFLF